VDRSCARAQPPPGHGHGGRGVLNDGAEATSPTGPADGAVETWDLAHGKLQVAAPRARTGDPQRSNLAQTAA
jgi:hypothetical protein